MSEPSRTPPVAPRREHAITVHGVTLSDPYAWLKAENWQDVLRQPAALPADIRAHLEAENAYGAAVMAGLGELQEQIAREMRGRIKEDDSSPPAPDGGFRYYTRYRTGGQHPLICRKPREGEEETILLDGEALAEGKPFFHLGSRRHTDDHRRLAWSSDDTGSEFYTIRVRDAATLQDAADVIEGATGEVVWDADGRSFLYVRLDDNHRPRRVYRHVLGEDPATDALIYEETAEGWFVHLGRSRSGRFAFIEVSDHETTEVRFLERADLTAAPRLIAPRQTELRYEVDHQGDRFVILTNADGAEDFKVVAAPIVAPGRENWTDLVPHRPGIMILDVAPFRDFLVRMEREDAKPRIVVRDAAGAEHAIAFDEEAYALWLSAGYEYDTSAIRFVYSSLTTPAETYDYDMASRARTLVKRQEVPSGHDPKAYVTRRLFAAAPDGEQVPISILHRADLRLDGSAPCLLYGYGAYGIAIPSDFDTEALSLVDRGFVYAIAHVRGGTEKGWRWYTGGKREKKTNTFTDFIAAGQALVGRGYTAKGRIVAQGRSAGGMLMGAVANMAPDLFAAVIGEVPFVDVMATMLDSSLPLTPPEWPEWGNPIASEEAFRTILAYSPTDTVSAQRYPAILAIGGLTDPRVTYWEPAKWVARLRETALPGGGPFVLRIDMDSGHGGASGRFDRLKEIAQSYAFAVGAVQGLLRA
ncbi:S9 family peptidase [Alsobacter soli]|uniref:S9 family peptidase n=1 Tax=Alsobacter soli TaxID=2109933 RepID=A0A2T1HSB8_9HYPH|nr:S9 family peptidase [Alsobacter soli]PSC04545.1 S9 family peptidase [Alsobacter soli]